MKKINNLLKRIGNFFKQIPAFIRRKDPRMIYVIFGIIVLTIIGVFIYKYLTQIWSDESIITLQEYNETVDGRVGCIYENALELSNTAISYSCTFSFWLNLHAMSNMQTTGANYILSYDMESVGIYSEPSFNIIYGSVDDATKNQITVMFKNMNNSYEYIIIRDIKLQKWLCIQIVMKDTIIDFYMNGELIKSKTLNYIPIISNNGTLTVGKENGFNGLMGKLTYYNYALKESDLDKYYNAGPPHQLFTT